MFRKRINIGHVIKEILDLKPTRDEIKGLFSGIIDHIESITIDPKTGEIKVKMRRL